MTLLVAIAILIGSIVEVVLVILTTIVVCMVCIGVLYVLLEKVFLKMKKYKSVSCQECKGTGKLVYSNTGIENDCMYCNGFGKVMEEDV
jgi:hypothetical protein